MRCDLFPPKFSKRHHFQFLSFLSSQDVSEPNFSFGLNFKVEYSTKMKIGTTKHRRLIKKLMFSFEEQGNPRTVKKTNSDDSKFVKFIQELTRLDDISLTQIHSAELDKYFYHFIPETRKTGGE